MNVCGPLEGGVESSLEIKMMCADNYDIKSHVYENL